METIEQIIANGLSVDFFERPYINATAVQDHIESICQKGVFDARPSTAGTIITALNAMSVHFEKENGGYRYTATIFSANINYRSFDSVIPFITFSVNEQGLPNGTFEAELLYNDGTGIKSLINNANSKKIREYVIENYTCYVNMIVSTMTFLNCRNIVLIDKHQLPSIARHYEKRYKIPCVTYKELVVTPISYRHKSETNCVPAGSMPLHLCRGHVKTYSEERPLFGRLSGQYYWHPHMRGNKENGETQKDYILQNN